MGVKEGTIQLLSKLRAGSDEATGIPSTGGKRQVIPSHEWRDLDVCGEKDRIVVRTEGGFGPGYNDVALPWVAAVKLWPAKEEVQPTPIDSSLSIGGAQELLRAEYDKRGFLSQHDGARIVRAKDPNFKRDVARRLTKELTGNEKRGPKGPRKNCAE